MQHRGSTLQSRSEPGAVGTWDEPCGSAMLNVDSMAAATRGQGIAAYWQNLAVKVRTSSTGGVTGVTAVSMINCDSNI